MCVFVWSMIDYMHDCDSCLWYLTKLSFCPLRWHGGVEGMYIWKLCHSSISLRWEIALFFPLCMVALWFVGMGVAGNACTARKCLPGFGSQKCVNRNFWR